MFNNQQMEVDDASLTLTAEDSCAMHAEQEVLMSVVSNSTAIGVAVYDVRDQSIGFCQAADSIGSSALFSRLGVIHHESSARDSYAALQLIKGQVNPSYIFVSSKADEHLVEACERPLDTSETEGDEVGRSFEVRKEKASAFNVANGLRMADMMRIQDQDNPNEPSSRPLLDSLIDLSKELVISALGALLFIMQRDGYGSSNRAIEDEDDESRMEIGISALFELPVQGCLQIDSATLRALSIFSLDDHPSKMGIGSSKEGFSLFSIISTRCCTPMGKRLMRAWMSRPLINLAVTRDRGDAISLFLHSSDVMSAFKGAMGGVKDIPKLLQLTSNSQMHPEAKVFKLMQQSMRQLLVLRGYMEELLADDGDPAGSNNLSLGARGSEGAEINQWRKVSISLKILTQVPRQALEDAVSLISDVVDFDSRGEEGIIQRGVCEELDALKQEYTELPETLTRVLQDELSRIPSFLSRGNNTQLFSIIFLPQLGYVLQVRSLRVHVPREPLTSLGRLLQVSGEPLTSDLMDELRDYEEILRGNAADGAPSIYYRTDLTRQLSDKLGDLVHKIGDLEGSLAIELISRLMALSPRLYGASMAIAELDCLMAFAACARDYGWNRAELCIDNVLEIKQGRHPLAELVTTGVSFIPNDCKMEAVSTAEGEGQGGGGGGKGRVQVITGPNASGKSVFIKQVALISYLAHLGSFVPASSARIGIVDRIFTRLVTTESPKVGMSSFMSDLSQVTAMVLKATDRSLCIIDEFGKGTLTSDGIGLLSAILSHFCVGSRGVDEAEGPSLTPRVLASTHFTELFDPRVLHRHLQLEFFTMDVMLQGSDRDRDNHSRIDASAVVPLDAQPVFLFRLVPGYSTPSFGIQCAKACGVPRNVLERAQELVLVQMEGQEDKEKEREEGVALEAIACKANI